MQKADVLGDEAINLGWMLLAWWLFTAARSAPPRFGAAHCGLCPAMGTLAPRSMPARYLLAWGGNRRRQGWAQ